MSYQDGGAIFDRDLICASSAASRAINDNIQIDDCDVLCTSNIEWFLNMLCFNQAY